MSIAWMYLDKKAAALAALKDYSNQLFVLESTEKRLKEAENNLTSIKSPSLAYHSKTNDPHQKETEIVSNMDEEAIIRKKYLKAYQFIQWFQPAWEFLSETDRFILSAFYLRDDFSQDSAEDIISNKLNIEHAAIYKRKNQALDRLTVVLFGSK